MLHLLLWYLTTLVISFSVIIPTMKFFQPLRSEGFAYSRIVGIAFLSLLVWITLNFGINISVVMASLFWLLMFFGVSTGIIFHDRSMLKRLWLQRNKMFVTEAIWIGLFGIVLLAMPVFLPIVLALGFDPIWFGILFCVNMQVSFLSPPFGPAAFYLKSVTPPHISLTDIFRGFGPFIVIQLIVLACVMFFPEFTTQNFHEFKPTK